MRMFLCQFIGWGGPVEALGELYANGSISSHFARWDSGYYLHIAQYNYNPSGTERAFFPLYPILIRFVSDISGLSIISSGIIVSILCFLAACLFMYRWVMIDYKPETAFLSVIWLCCFPMTFFFVSCYACGLFLMLSVSSIYFARRGQFIASGVAIALAGATRPTAFLLAIPFLAEFWQQKIFSRKQFLNMGIGAIIAPMGLLGYSLFLIKISGNTNVFAGYSSIQSAEWQRYITWPWITLYDGVKAALFGSGINSDWFSKAIVWHDLLYAIAGMAAAIYGLFRLRLSNALFLLFSMIFFYANHGPQGYAFWSIPRYIAALFPIYLILALVTNRLPPKIQWALLIGSISLLGVLSAWFASGRWVA